MYFVINSIKMKLKEYLRRNFSLQKQYFSPVSLIRLIDLFVKSRLSYGISCFLDCPSEMNKVEKILTSHLKSMFNLPVGTSHRRLLVTLGEPDLNITLATRLLNTWHKYKKQFDEYPPMYEKVLLKYFKLHDLYPTTDLGYCKANIGIIKRNLINENIINKSLDFLKYKVRPNHRSYLKQYIFTFPNLQNFHVIRYFTHTCKSTNKLLYPICHCGKENIPSHGANDCKEKLKNRDSYLQKLNKVFDDYKLKRLGTIYDYLNTIFFSIENEIGAKGKNLLFQYMREIIFTIISEDTSECILNNHLDPTHISECGEIFSDKDEN